MSIWIQGVPIKVLLPRKKTKDKVIYLNLNVYRNTHYIILNQAKQIFTEQMRPHLENLKVNTPFAVRYYLYLGSNREADVANICSIVDKFFCDSLVHYGCIPDDNFKFLKGVSYEFVDIQSGNGHIDIEIIEL